MGTRDVENFISKQRVQKTKEWGARGFVKDSGIVGAYIVGRIQFSHIILSNR